MAEVRERICLVNGSRSRIMPDHARSYSHNDHATDSAQKKGHGVEGIGAIFRGKKQSVDSSMS
jgi:hypothetical protein